MRREAPESWGRERWQRLSSYVRLTARTLFADRCMKRTGSEQLPAQRSHGAGGQAERGDVHTVEPLERVRLQAEVARQRVRIAKDELKRARKRLKEAKREARSARKLASSARKKWKRARKKAKRQNSGTFAAADVAPPEITKARLKKKARRSASRAGARLSRSGAARRATRKRH